MAQPQPQRTENSLVFGIPARLCTSVDPRFVWSDAQIHVMVNWIRANPRRFGNLETLLEALDLHGFGPDILDLNGQPIGAMIQKKVKNKVGKLRAQLRDGWLPPALPQNANAGPGNAPIPGYNINIINPDGQ
ncbi:hypothetical protein F5B21DRAFT_85312 [Xylaria acuta]|nr:hypothetical protein F5B21DRAFT_85312 [Xylaria acuta]